MNRRKKKVLVTGASGFLGSHICDELHNAGYEVHALIRTTSSSQWLNHSWLKIHVSELNDRKALSRILKGTYAIIHSAGALPGSPPEVLQSINVNATRFLAQQAVAASVKRFVYISSRAAGGINYGSFWKTEDEPDGPNGSYGRSKRLGEKALSELLNPICVINLRYSLIYGPRDTHTLRIFKVISSRIFPILGMKTIYNSLVHVKDAARAAVAALSAGVESGSFFYITDGVAYTFDSMFTMMRKAMGLPWGCKLRIPLSLARIGAGILKHFVGNRAAFSPDSVNELASRYRLASPEKAIRELGWRPGIMSEQGFRETVQWYRERGWLK